MKQLYTIISLFIISITGTVFSQAVSEITYSTGTQIEVQTGADVCATNIIVNGTFSGGGTFCSGALPVLLSEFHSEVNKNNVILRWKTETELNNSGFDIERKPIEGTQWQKTAFVPGSGTTNEPKVYLYEDKKLQVGTYQYRLKQIDFNGAYEYFPLPVDVVISRPEAFSLGQNYPNPSNPKSKIDFEIPVKGMVNISVYNLLGELVAQLVNEIKEPGNYTAEFDGGSLSSGTYFYRIVSEGFTSVKKMILVK
jgi:hypothetical protein